MVKNEILAPIHKEDEDGKFCLFVILTLLEVKQSDIQQHLEDIFFSYENQMYIILKQKNLESIFINHKKFNSDYDLSNGLTLYIFDMDQEDIKIFDLFYTGSWSKFPKSFVNKMELYTELSFGKTKPGKPTRVFSIFVSALLKTKFLKKSLEDYLNEEISNDLELMQQPSSKNYTTLDSIFDKYLIEELE